MAFILTQILAQAANGSPITAALSSEGVAVLLMATGLLENLDVWIDPSAEPGDTVTPDDLVEIIRLIGLVARELMTEANVSSGLIGEVFPYVTATVPLGCLDCDGAVYNRVDYPDLYAVLHANYRIDADTFRVPDMRGRAPIGTGTGSGLTPRAVNAQGGAETHTLSVAEMPAHTHPIRIEGGANPSASYIDTGLANTQFQTVNNAVQSAGGGGAHNNMQPFTAIQWCVRYATSL